MIYHPVPTEYHPENLPADIRNAAQLVPAAMLSGRGCPDSILHTHIISVRLLSRAAGKKRISAVIPDAKASLRVVRVEYAFWQFPEDFCPDSPDALNFQTECIFLTDELLLSGRHSLWAVTPAQGLLDRVDGMCYCITAYPDLVPGEVEFGFLQYLETMCTDAIRKYLKEYGSPVPEPLPYAVRKIYEKIQADE